jgi:hypothetical protein
MPKEKAAIAVGVVVGIANEMRKARKESRGAAPAFAPVPKQSRAERFGRFVGNVLDAVSQMEPTQHAPRPPVPATPTPSPPAPAADAAYRDEASARAAAQKDAVEARRVDRAIQNAIDAAARAQGNMWR